MKKQDNSPNQTTPVIPSRKYSQYNPTQYPPNRVKHNRNKGKQSKSFLLTSDISAYSKGFGYGSGYIIDEFPEDSEDFIALSDICNPLVINKKDYKIDKAFYEPLKQLTGHLFMTLKFLSYRYCSKSISASQLRRSYVLDFFKEIASRLNMPQNDFQYFATEEDEFKVGRHVHLIVYLKYPDKHPPGSVLKEILDLLKNPRMVHIPSTHNRHAQIIQNSDKVLRYCLKLKADEHEKPFFHSAGLCRFHHRRLNWLKKPLGGR